MVFLNISFRYQIAGEIDFKNLVTDDKLQGEKRNEVRKSLKQALQEKYRALPVVKSSTDKGAHLRFFFNKLKF